jgi:hypothetical protein
MKKFFSAILLAAILSLPGIVAYAAPLVECGGAGQRLCGICDLFNLINNIILYVLMVFVPLGAGLVIAIAGIKMLIDRENAEVWDKSKEIILMTVIGLVLIYGAYAIVITMFSAMGYTGGNPLKFDNVNCP